MFQPIVDLGRDEVCGYEVLARFNAGPPRRIADWFAAADAVGALGRLEALALSAGLRARARLPANCFLSINVTPQGLRSPEVREVLATAGALDRVVLEITEHRPVEDYIVLGAALAELREAGAMVAVDDAGAGYASLRHVMALRPEFIKLDRELVRYVDADPAKEALIEAMGAFAGRIDAWLVAEGIERQSERVTLRRLGVPLGQGFLYGRPAAGMDGPPIAQPRPWDRDASVLAPLLDPVAAVPVADLAYGIRRFAEEPAASHLAVIDLHGRPVALLARDDLPADPLPLRPSLLVLPSEALCVVAERGITRPREWRFDPLVCCDELGHYLGLLPLERIVSEVCQPPHAKGPT